MNALLSTWHNEELQLIVSYTLNSSREAIWSHLVSYNNKPFTLYKNDNLMDNSQF